MSPRILIKHKYLHNNRVFFLIYFKDFLSLQMNRIQKLLLYEYRDLDDTVLIESPFAQINEHGFGIRQVQLGI